MKNELHKYLKSFLIIVFSLPVFLFAQSNDSINIAKENNKRKIIIRGDNSCPPYEFINTHGNPDGFNVELIKAIMDDLNLDYEIKLYEWNKSVGQVQKGEADILIGIIPLKSQEKYLNFSIPNTFINYRIICRKDSHIMSVEDLKNKDILVVDGKIIKALLDYSIIPGNQVVVDNMQTGLEMLSKGKYDAAICDNDIALYYIKQHGLNNLEIKSLKLPSFDMCIATSKKDVALVSQINNSLESLKSSGRYHEIYSKWFGFRNISEISPKAMLVIGIVLSLLLVVSIFFYLLRIRVKVVTKNLTKAYDNERIQLKKLNTILTSLPIGFVICDKNGIIKYINQSLAELCGIKDVDAHIAKKLSLFDDPIIDKAYKEKVKLGQDTDFSMIYDLKKISTIGFFDTNYSHKIFVDLKFRVIKDDNGDIVDILILIQDLTDNYKQKRELEIFKQNLSLAIDAGNLKVWEYDIAKNIIIPIYGNNETANISQPFDAFCATIHPDDGMKFTSTIKSLFNINKEKASCKIRTWNDDKGDFEYTEVEMITRHSPDLKAIGIVGTSRKITHEYLLETNLKRISESLNLSIAETKLDIWLFNIEDQRFSILKDGEFKARNITFAYLLSHIHTDDTDDFHSIMLSLVDGEMESGEITYRIKYFTKPEYLIIKCNIKSIQGIDGKISSLIASCRKQD